MRERGPDNHVRTFLAGWGNGVQLMVHRGFIESSFLDQARDPSPLENLEKCDIFKNVENIQYFQDFVTGTFSAWLTTV